MIEQIIPKAKNNLIKIIKKIRNNQIITKGIQKKSIIIRFKKSIKEENLVVVEVAVQRKINFVSNQV